MIDGITALLPATVEVEETTTDAPESALLPEERQLIAGAAQKRRAEFITVRACARLAMRRLGIPPLPIVPGANREPQWPARMVGSLTHCEGYRAAAVAHASEIMTIGIDAEIHQPLPGGVAALVTGGAEKLHLAHLGRESPDIAWDRILFSAKESVYKAWYPLSHTWLSFTECELVIDPVRGTFVGRILIPGVTVDNRIIDRFTGRWTIQGRHVLTAVYEMRK